MHLLPLHFVKFCAQNEYFREIQWEIIMDSQGRIVMNWCRPDYSQGQQGWLPSCPLFIALVPLEFSSRNLQFPDQRVAFTKEKMPWCPCIFKNRVYSRPEDGLKIAWTIVCQNTLKLSLVTKVAKEKLGWGGIYEILRVVYWHSWCLTFFFPIVTDVHNLSEEWLAEHQA